MGAWTGPADFPLEGPMLAVLHGELEPHPWRDPSAAADAYGLFYARSEALGWLTPAHGCAPQGGWAMNDAGRPEDPSAWLPQIAWFQVQVTHPLHPERPLPTQAFLNCIDDVMARMGRLNLKAVQLLLPLPNLGDPARHSSVEALGVLLQGAGWLTDGPPSRSTHVWVTLDSGQDPAIITAAPHMREYMQELRQDAFLMSSAAGTEQDAPVLEPAVWDDAWPGPSKHRAAFHGALAEWSLDAVGWLAGLLSEVAARQGVHTPLLFTAVKA
ncbi:hypothetical protein Ppa06_05760 [Planomonospora parontospora subsp. parontospora]|uniref:Uncharacterized protein n=2 Tax=Planomonospora parontospora TaxID=58119 RepID=A0AA37F2H9_9ACTN|nr:hypothetical protein [Planomonospora parontospora]GGK49042.1 hypothetical protein GCM10010126_05770 [Planomonospora parontospora]GII06778.1 hypothetical protein Ppa06_05760 [Planomonospora parontospora subsp. parontospora]